MFLQKGAKMFKLYMLLFVVLYRDLNIDQFWFEFFEIYNYNFGILAY